MSAFTRPSGEVVALDEIRVRVRETIGPYAADRLEICRLLDSMMIELSTYVLAERLQTERVRERRREQIETARFASWWDHWKATYRGRWWMRWRRWPVRQHVDVHEIEAVAVVDLSRYWTFPRANVAAPPLGEPVRVMTYTMAREIPQQPPTTRSAPDRVDR